MLSTSTASLNQPLKGIKAYKDTIESAAQAHSFFDYIHLGGRGNVDEEKLDEENVYKGARDLVIPSNLQKRTNIF